MGTACRNSGLAVLCALAVACSSGADSHEALARMAFEALKQGDLAPFEDAVPTAADLEELLEIFREKAGEEEYRKALAYNGREGGFAARAEKLREEVRKSIERTRESLAT